MKSFFSVGRRWTENMGNNDHETIPIVMPYVVSVVTCGVCGHVVYSFSK